MYVLFAAAFLLLLYYLQLNIYSRLWDRDLKADATFGTNEVFEGEMADLTETLENEKWLPLPMLKMKLQLSRELLFRDADNSIVSDYFYRTDIYSIGAYQRVTRSMKFCCSKRGYYTFRGVDMICSNLFFTKEYVKSVDSSSYLYVFPKLYNPGIMEPVLNRINGETLVRHNVVEDPFEFRGIREYQPYDGMKNINWKASAKSEELMVNVHDYTAHRTIRVFIDLDKPKVSTRDEILELCISMAASNVASYAGYGILTSVYSNGKDILTDAPLFIEEGCGDNFIRNVNRFLARLDLTKKPDNFEKLFKDLLIDEAADSYAVIYAANLKDELQDILCEMLEKKMDFCWVCPVNKGDKLEVREELKEKCLQIPAEEAMYEISLS